MFHKRHVLALCLLVASGSCANAVPGSSESASTDPMMELGTLTCSLMGGREGASAGISRSLLCSFQPGDAGPIETYTGSIQGIGRPELLFGKGAVLLAVKAPASVTVSPGMLAQTYAADAGASGGAPAPLVGDTNKQIVLQPQMDEVGRVAEGKTQPDAVIITVELVLQATPA